MMLRSNIGGPGAEMPGRPLPGRSGPSRGRGGNAAVEFALLAPVVLLLILGSCVTGLYLGVAHSVQQLAGEAARAAVPGLTEAERTTLARRFVATAIGGYGLLRPEALTVSAAFEPADPDIFTVTLSYDASVLGLGGLSNLVPISIDRLQRRASVRRGGA